MTTARPTTTIAIAGITGKFAALLTRHLLAKPSTRISGIARNPAKLPSSLTSNPRVTIFKSDADDPTALRAALKGADVCICCYLGDNALMVDGQKALVDACVAERVPRYVASDWSLDYRKLAYGEHPAKDPMKRVAAYLEEKEKETEGAIKGVHVLNGAFMEVFFSFLRCYEPEGKRVWYWGSGEEKFEVTTYEDAAWFTAEVAVDRGATGVFNILGDRISAKELAAAVKEVYGEEPSLERLGSQEELYEKMTAAFKQAPQNPRAWTPMFYTYRMINGQTLLGKLDNDRYPGFAPTSVKDFLGRFTPDTVVKSAFF